MLISVAVMFLWSQSNGAAKKLHSAEGSQANEKRPKFYK